MKNIYLIAAVASALFVSAGTVAASTITRPGNQAGTTWTVDNVATWNTTGNTMAGLSIKANFVDATGVFQYSSTLQWSDNIGVSESLANGTWSFGLNDYNSNTWDATTLWSLTNTTDYYISSLVLAGASGNTVFDVRVTPIYTPNSDVGRRITSVDTNADLQVSAVYSNLVAVAGDPLSPYSDLYETLTLTFSHGTNSSLGFRNESFTAILDTDNVNATPEPATMLLFGLGIAGLAGIRARKQK